MKIEDLIERLQEIAEQSPGADVVLAVQPSYPIRESLRGVAFAEDAIADLHEEHDEDPDGDPMACPECAEEHGTVWLVSGGQSSRHDVSPYAPRWVFEAVG